MQSVTGRRRAITVVLAALLGAGTLVALPGEPGSAPGWLSVLERGAGRDGTDADAARRNRLAKGATIAPGTSTGVQPAKVTFPAAAKWDVTPGAEVAGRPVQVRAGAKLGVQVLDRTAAERIGASGFLFRVTGGSGTKADLSVDYAGFANAYGAGYADRLRLVTVPDCALTTPLPADCPRIGAEVPAANDRTGRKLEAKGADLTGASTFAVISAVGGDEGTFAASPLSVTGSWQVSPGSGAFNYSYPIDIPEPAGGSAPSLTLGYTSAAVDGMTVASNTQASPVGVGWSDFASSFIERRYEPCFRRLGTLDLCWKSDNATISLAGISGPLLPIGGNQWRVQSDPNWKIERLTGANYTEIHEKQYWKVTAPDGTQYFFGYGHMPGHITNSILGVQVVADQPGEPCWDAANNRAGGCEQGWRWYLDRIVDTDGNVQSYVYEREENWYFSALGNLGGRPMSKYHRAASLKEIYYGGRGWDVNSYAGKVTFGVFWRCGYLVEHCPAPAPNSGSAFPDTPTDLLCTNDPARCQVNSPSFFTARRYGWVRTEVRVGTGGPESWRKVAQHNIYHGWSAGEGVSQKLQVNSIQHAALAFGKLNNYPLTSFRYKWLDNRADHANNIPKAMRHNRIDRVTTPFGGTITVTYARNRGCGINYQPPQWDLNVMDCFPQSIKEGNHLRTGIFNKFVVQQVVEDPGGGQQPMTTSYAYEGTPAWSFDTTSFARDDDEAGWSVWRGYEGVTVTKGTAKTRLRMFRGWDDDWTLQQDAGGDLVPSGRRQVDVATVIEPGLRFEDHASLAGRTLEEIQLGTLNGVPDSPMLVRRYEYTRVRTHDPGPGYMYDAEWVGTATTTERVYTSATAFRDRRSRTTYNSRYQPVSTLEEGWLDVAGDERCSLTSYAESESAWIFTLPSSNKLVSGQCTSTTVLEHSETYYDNATTFGAPPTRGNPTRQRTLIESGRWAETNTTFDDLGRPTRVVDPTGAATTTAYTVSAGAPASQLPIRATVTNALNQQTVTDLHPEFGVPHIVRDPNGNVTRYDYDEFGRLDVVWLPDAPYDFAEPSIRFKYDIANSAVLTRRLVSAERTGANVRFEDSWVIYDGFWRERQVQSPSPVSGKVLLSETVYDNRGLVQDETVEQAVTGTIGRYIGGTSWVNRTRHEYDQLGRNIRRHWMRGASIAHTTATSYGQDTVTVTGPDGRQVRERVDGLGRTVGLEEYDGSTWVASSYRYDLAGRLTQVTDPSGNRIDYTYNQAGWRRTQQDANRGSASYTYDNAGRRLSLTDGRGNQIHTKYDPLGRATERRSGSVTGPLLASWAYDTAPLGVGKLHRESTFTAGGTWVSEMLGYDNKGRMTGSRLTVPAGVNGLSGTYTVTQTHDRADRVRSVTYPGMGGLPAETVTTDYNALGLPTRMASPLAEYVWGVTYDDRGRTSSTGFGPRPGGATWMATNVTYDADQRFAGDETYLSGAIVADHEVGYDLSGNIVTKMTRQQSSSWRECYDHDARNRLTSAHTVVSSTTCTAGTPGTGDRPYAHTYRYAADGRLLERVENGTSTTYAYPASGAARPHAPTRVGTSTYTWDDAGNLATRTVGGQAETFTWDVQNQLASTTKAGASTSYVYDPSGQRLLRRNADGSATLYVAGHEVTANASGSSVTAVRSYAFDGRPVATRTPAGVDYLVADPAGSVEMSIPSGGAPASTRAYLPFGRVRFQTGDMATDRGFIGQVEDSSTGLSYLNARYYDPTTAVFISADPLYGPDAVQTLNPYTYSTNNPTSFADPSGLMSAYSFGLEVENSALRQQNKELIAHIGKLGNHIEYLQDVIKDQQKQINKLVRHIRALEAEIARQASIIQRLQARVAYLERVVVAQQREISRLWYVVARQQQIIRYQAGVIRHQAGIIRHQQKVINWQAGRIRDLSYKVKFQAGVISKLGAALGARGGGGGYRGGGGGSGSVRRVAGWTNVCPGVIGEDWPGTGGIFGGGSGGDDIDLGDIDFGDDFDLGINYNSDGPTRGGPVGPRQKIALGIIRILLGITPPQTPPSPPPTSPPPIIREDDRGGHSGGQVQEPEDDD